MVRKTRIAILAIFCLFLPFFTYNAFSQGQKIVDFKQITTHPDIDLCPNLSPDGKWLAYISRRLGNFDIWIQRISGGRSYPITSHKADDYYPVWGPDNKTIYFVSQRSDAAGDIWRIQLKIIKDRVEIKGEPKQISFYQGFDGYPTVAPDGKKIAWVSDRDGQENIWFFNYNNDKTVQLTWQGATHPSWSPNARYLACTSFRSGTEDNGDIWVMDLRGHKLITDEDIARMQGIEPKIWRITHGPALDGFPSWSSDSKKLVFLRHSLDTNKDDKLSPADLGVVWSVEIFESPLPDSNQIENIPMLRYIGKSFNLLAIGYAMPLTPGAKQTLQPWYGANDRIYFSSGRGGNMDVWTLPAQGSIPDLGDPVEQYNFAEESYPLPLRMSRQSLGPLYRNWNPSTLTDKEASDLWNRFLVMRRVVDFNRDNSESVARALLEMGVCYKLLGYPDQAKEFLKLLTDNYQSERAVVAFAEIAKLGLTGENLKNNISDLRERLIEIIDSYKEQTEPASEARIAIGDLYFDAGKYPQAFEHYSSVLRDYPSERSSCAESQLKIGDVFKMYATKQEVVDAYLSVVNHYPDQREWMIPARNRILDLLTAELTGEQELLSRYREIIGQYGEFVLLAAAAQLRIGNVLEQSGDYDAALTEFEAMDTLFPNLTDEVFEAQMKRADIYLTIGESLRAFHLLKSMTDSYRESRPDLSQAAHDALLLAYLRSADELKRSQDFELALARYRNARLMDERSIRAHRGYIECKYFLRKIDEAITEYEALAEQNPYDNVIIYSLGLTYSYKGTEKSEFEQDPDALDSEYLNRSSGQVARALGLDFTLVQAYLTLAYNYEMLETYYSRQRAKPKPFLHRVFNTLTAPILSVYHTLTFYEEKRPQMYYERAIHELTKALALNDETENRGLEANLALNLANNYYNLGEFGYEKAYEYYHLKLYYDSTFVDKQREILIYERMGHCALKTEDVEGGSRYLSKAIDYCRQLGDEKRELLNIKRLALLYEIGGQNDMAIEYYQTAADIETRIKRYDALMRSYRSIAYNFLILEEPEEAARFGRLSLDILESGKVKESKYKASRIKVGFLGLYVPVPFIDLSSMGTTSAATFTTDDERALIYTILGLSSEQMKDYNAAIEEIDKKLRIYRKRKDAAAEAAFLNNAGYLHHLNGDYRLAWNAFLTSLEICEKEKNSSGIIINTLNLAKMVARSRMKNEPSVHSTYRLTAVKKINAALGLYDNEILTTDDKQIQLLILLAELSLEDYGSTNDRIASTMRRIEQTAVAKTYLDEALQLSERFHETEQECTVHYSLGELFVILQEPQSAYTHYLTCQRLAVKYGYYDILWRVDTKLGLLLSSISRAVKRQLSVREDAFEFYDEAIKILQAHNFKYAGTIAQTWRLESESPYRNGISYLSEKGDVLGALRLTEQLRAKHYFDLINNENLTARKERHKLHYGNAKYLRDEINQLEIDLLRSKSQKDITPIEEAEMRSKYKQYSTEYAELLKQISQEAPELESIIHPKAIELSQIQSTLLNRAILYYIALDDFSLVWMITRDRIRFEKIDVTYDELWRDGQRFSAHSDNIADISAIDRLFSPFVSQFKTVRECAIIPDTEFLLFPWTYFGKRILSPSSSSPLAITVSSSLTSYFYSFNNRKIRGNQIYLSDRSRELLFANRNFTILPPIISKQNNSFPDQIHSLELADIILLNVQTDWRPNEPAHSRMGYIIKTASPAVFKPLNLYQLSLNAALVQLNFDQTVNTPDKIDAFLSWERAFINAGIPSLLITLWPGDEQSDAIFISTFYEKLSSLPAVTALAETQNLFIQQGKPPSFWARFQIYGFGGMSEEEVELYASQGFETMVRRGHSAFDLGEWSDAIRFYSEAYEMALRQKDETSMERIQRRILESAVNGSVWDKAIEIQRQLTTRAEAENNISAMAAGYRNLAFFYTENKQYPEGIAYKQKYTTLTERYGLYEEEANSIRETGLIYERGGNYDKAVEAFQQAGEKYAELKHTKGEALCLQDIGRIHFFYLDHYTLALEYQQKALPLFESLGNSPEYIVLLQNLALTHESIANYKEALYYLEKALRLAGEISNEELSVRTKQYLANIHWKMGDYQIALSYQTAALEKFKEQGADSLLQVAYATRGLIALSLGRQAEAMNYQLEGLELAKSNGNRRNQAVIYKNIGIIQRASGQAEQALSSFELAAEIDSSLNSKRGLAYDWRNIGALFTDLDSLKSAQHRIRQALKLSTDINDWRNRIQCLAVLGRILCKDGQVDSARSYFTQAASDAERLFMPDIEWRVYRDLAEIELQGKKQEEAIENYYRAVEVIERMRSRIKVEEYASGFVDDKLAVYGDLITLLAQSGQTIKALELVERAKSRNFIDMLGNRKLQFKSGESNLLAATDSLQAELRTAQMKLFNLRTETIEQPVVEKELEKDIVRLKDLLASRFLLIRQQNPELSEMMSVEPWPFSDIQRMLPDNTAIIEYYTYDDRVFIWVIKTDDVTLHSQQTQFDLSTSIFSMREAISRELSITKWTRVFYDDLFLPVAKDVQGINHIVIVPHAELHYLPFAALQNENGEYLGLSHSLSLSPSATVLGFCLRKGTKFVDMPIQQLDVLALGNPDLGNPELNLPFAEKEVKSLGRYFPSNESYLNRRATETLLYEIERIPPIVLFSCHGVYDDAVPLLSALLLSSDDKNDGRLEAHEIFALNLDAYMVAMSACETGLGTIRGGDEVIGLTRSFIYAGASSLMTSLWKVDDLATAILVKRFFRYLSEGNSRSEALRLAQKIVFDYFDPYPGYWAAFTVTGDFR